MRRGLGAPNFRGSGFEPFGFRRGSDRSSSNTGGDDFFEPCRHAILAVINDNRQVYTNPRWVSRGRPRNVAGDAGYESGISVEAQGAMGGETWVLRAIGDSGSGHARRGRKLARCASGRSSMNGTFYALSDRPAPAGSLGMAGRGILHTIGPNGVAVKRP